jgi:hypothetical protein
MGVRHIFLSVSVKAKIVLKTFSPLRDIFLFRLAIIRFATCSSLVTSYALVILSEYHENEGVNLGGVLVRSMLHANPMILPVVIFVFIAVFV